MASVSLLAVVMLAEAALSNPNAFDCRITCTSIGIIRVRRSMKSFHSPRSTGDSVRDIHLRNIHSRLHDDLVLRGMMPSEPSLRKYPVRLSHAERASCDVLCIKSPMEPWLRNMDCRAVRKELNIRLLYSR